MNPKEEKKILIVHDYLTTFGGAEKVLEGIIDAFPNAEIFTSKYIPEKFINSRIAKLAGDNKIRESWIFKHFPISDKLIPLQRKIAGFAFLFLNISKYDIIFFNTSGPATWVIANKRSDQKFLAYYHKITSIDFQYSKNILKKLFTKFNKYFINKLDIIVTNSIFNKENFIKIYKIPDYKLKVIYPFISDHDLNIIKQNFQKEKEEYYIYIGRLELYKGISEIIDTFIDLGLKLKVIGEGPLKKTLSKAVNIEYLGFVDQNTKFSLLSKSKALISLGGKREEFGITYLESILCGTPFIALNKGGALEIGNSNSAKFLSNVDGLVSALKDFEKNPLKITNVQIEEAISKFNEGRFISEIRTISLI